MKKITYLVLAILLVAGIASATDINVTPANSSYLAFPAKTTAVTNGQVLSVDNTFMNLTCAGANTTVTNTLAAPLHGNVLAILGVASGQTNNVKITTSTIGALAANYTLTAGGRPLFLISSGTNYWYELQSPDATNLVAGYVLAAVDGSAVTNLSAANVVASSFPDAMVFSGAESVRGLLTANTLTATGAVIHSSTMLQTGVATFTAQPIFNAAILAAPTGTAVGGLSVKINGTNYAIAVIIPN